MFGLSFLKVSPTTHVIQYRKGSVVREGPGLSFFYFAPNSVIQLVPVGSIDVPFVFDEVTSDFQDATIQGEITYRITDPVKTGALLDFSVDSRSRYLSEDPAKLGDRLIRATQILSRSYTQDRGLNEVLVGSDALVEAVLGGLRSSETVAMLGVEILGLSIASITAAPEMAKALQADAREQLLRRADEAVFERRNAAVEQERKIKENELKTDIAVEEKRRQVRETKMQADVAVEEQRAELVDRHIANEAKEAKSRGAALQATLAPLKGVDWRTLLAVSGGLDAKSLIAIAFRDLADNAEKIGNLNISPDLLQSLLDLDGTEKPAPSSPRKKR
jgi:regulator of protease activity HflC (stomatin/prohibitin superfamily)